MSDRTVLDELSDEIRGLIENLMACEHQRVDFAKALSLAAELRQTLDGPRRGPHFNQSGDPRENRRLYLEHSMFGGRRNPLGLPTSISEVHTPEGARRTTAVVTLGRAYEGATGLVHGGYVAALFDHVLGLAQEPRGDVFAATRSLTVHYRRPTPLAEELTFTAWYESRDDATVRGVATCHAGGVLTAKAEGDFRQKRLTEMHRRADRGTGP